MKKISIVIIGVLMMSGAAIVNAQTAPPPATATLTPAIPIPTIPLPVPTPPFWQYCLDGKYGSCIAAAIEQNLLAFAFVLILLLSLISVFIKPIREMIQKGVENKLGSLPFLKRRDIRKYLKVFIAQNEHFGFRGMEMLAIRAIKLTQAYVQLDLHFDPEKTISDQEEKMKASIRAGVEGGAGKEPIHLAQILKEGHKRISIVGDAGSGKSALLQWAGLTVAQHHLRQKLRLDQKEMIKAIGLNRTFSPLIPVILLLRKFHSFCKEKDLAVTADALYEYIEGTSKRDYKREALSKKFFCHVLKKGCLLMLDGIDEVDFDDRPAVRNAVEGLLADEKNCKRNLYLITTRRSAAEIASQLIDFRTADVQPLTKKKRKDLIDHWCESVYITPSDVDEKSRDLGERIENELVRDMADTPLMVNIFGMVYFNKRDLPSQRAELFEYAVLALLTDPQREGQAAADAKVWGGRQLNQRRDDVSLIAYILHDLRKDDIFVEDLISMEVFWKRFGNEKETAQQAGRDFMELVARRGGLLRQNGPRYDFYIRRFREYLAARYTAQKLEDQWRTIIKTHLRDDQWEEPFQLAIGFLAFTNLEKAEKFMRILLEVGKNETQYDQALTIAGLALGDILKFPDEQIKRVFADMRENLPPNIIKIFTKNPPTSKNRLRQRLGLALGEISDPRLVETPARIFPDVKVILPEMLSIREGIFRMGTDRTEEELLTRQEITVYEDEKPDHPVMVGKFQIARHPVTNAEFGLFVEQGGYDPQAEWWSSEGKSWRNGTLAADLGAYPSEFQQEIREWLEMRPATKRNQPFYWDQPRWKAANLPVVGVCWYEAEAYANWLKTITGEPYRLPREAEWEKAARGPQNSIWPWGDTWQAEYCNNSESVDRIDGTSPVGMYPQGTWQGGPEDMIGNVWEWCMDRYDADEYKKRASGVKDPHGPAEGSSRVLRGGSWNSDRSLARCAYRSRLEPDYHNNNIGFRLVLAPSDPSGL